MNKTDHVSESVVYSPQSKHLRPANRYLTSLSFPADDYCLLIGEIPAGATVPLHSHSDRETFYGYWLGSPEDNEAIGLATNR